MRERVRGGESPGENVKERERERIREENIIGKSCRDVGEQSQSSNRTVTEW